MVHDGSITDGMHQMGFTQSGGAVKKQRVESQARVLYDFCGGGIGEVIGIADNESIECIPGIEQRQIGT